MRSVAERSGAWLPKQVRLLIAAAAVMGSCNPQIHYPGNVQLGRFNFTGERLSSTCGFDLDGGNLDGPLAFTGVFSQDSSSGVLYLTVGQTSHVGTLTGAHFRVIEEPAFRDLGCESMGNEVDETLEGDFYTYEQAQGLGNACPATDGGADGGAPADAGSDGGITADAGSPLQDAGAPLDALPDAGQSVFVLACGQLTNVIHADLDAGCGQAGPGFPCTAVFGLVGKTE